jgi:hypothetical protein
VTIAVSTKASRTFLSFEQFNFMRCVPLLWSSESIALKVPPRWIKLTAFSVAVKIDAPRRKPF